MNNEEPDVYHKINSDYYKNKLPYTWLKDDPVANRLYHEEERRLDKLFKQEALQEVGLSKHPKKDKIYEKAWERGHSAGYMEVLSNLQDLAELFEDELSY